MKMSTLNKSYFIGQHITDSMWYKHSHNDAMFGVREILEHIINHLSRNMDPEMNSFAFSLQSSLLITATYSYRGYYLVIAANIILCPTSQMHTHAHEHWVSEELKEIVCTNTAIL